ncbi:MAG: helix-turn-helix domain-containing protein [Nanoarchaeota archaeon]
MDTQILEDIGLSAAEIKVYLALLELGTSTAGPILEKSGLQNSVVHMTLNRLIERGLVSSVKQGKRNNYQPADPHHIVDFIEEKRSRFEQLLPELLMRQNQAKERPQMTMFRGIKGIRESLMVLLDAGGTEHHTFGSTAKSLMLGEAWWVSYHKNRARRGIIAKLMFNESLAFWKAETKYPRAEVRYTTAGFEPLTETIIRNDMVGIIIWSEKPLGIIVHQKEAAESYDKFFQIMWGTAHPAQ